MGRTSARRFRIESGRRGRSTGPASGKAWRDRGRAHLNRPGCRANRATPMTMLFVLEQLHERLLRLLLAFEELTVKRGGLLGQSLKGDQTLPCVLKRDIDSGRGWKLPRRLRSRRRARFLGPDQPAEIVGVALAVGVRSARFLDWFHCPFGLFNAAAVAIAQSVATAHRRLISSHRHARSRSFAPDAGGATDAAGLGRGLAPQTFTVSPGRLTDAGCQSPSQRVSRPDSPGPRARRACRQGHTRCRRSRARRRRPPRCGLVLRGSREPTS